MNVVERALLFHCAGEWLPAIIACPVPGSAGGQQPTGNGSAGSTAPATGTPMPATDCGVLVVVGGPQYRVGSHRQFLLLARRLAGAGYPAMRFDYRGMGDGSGEMRSFEQVSADIAAAVDALQRACPGVTRVVLWGLCDAASAALLYVEETGDPRIAGLALLNPWVRSESSLAQTRIKHYYGQRLLQGEFWRKLLSGRMEIMKSLRTLATNAALARRAKTTAEAPQQRSFQERMAQGWRDFSGGLLLILSGQDYTAKEFLEFAGTDPAWSGLTDRQEVRRIDLADADHTFSSRRQRAEVEEATLSWLTSISDQNRPTAQESTA